MLIHLLILLALSSVVTMVLVLMCCAAGARADVEADALAEELRVDLLGVERAVELGPVAGARFAPRSIVTPDDRAD
jgi:hypothetical protein